MAFLAQTSFNSGELSPWLDARTDVDAYGRGCRRLRNMLVTPYGGVRRRPGSQYIGAAKSNTTISRLWGFNFSTEASYVLEWSDKTVRFYTAGARVTVGTPAAWANDTAYTAGQAVSQGSTNYVCLATHTSATETDKPGSGSGWEAVWHPLQGAILELPTPYAAADLFELSLVQVNDVVWITHQDYAPRLLSRLAAAEWKLEEIDFGAELRYPPLRDENVDDQALVALVPDASVPEWDTVAYVPGNIVKAKPALWKNNVTYREDNYCKWGNDTFRCIKGHLNIQPIYGANWQLYWVKLAGTYRLYRCIIGHTGEAAKQPWVGATWTSYWALTGPSVGDTVTVNAPAGTFLPDPAHVGAFFEIGHVRDWSASEVKLLLDYSSRGGYSRPVQVVGPWSMSTASGKYAFEGVLYLQRSTDGSTWHDYRRYDNPTHDPAQMEEMTNFTDSGNEEEPVWLRLHYDEDIQYTTFNGATASLRAGLAAIYGLVRITAAADSSTATAVVERPFADTLDTKLWSEGAWSVGRGYPRCAALHEARLFYAGSPANPNTLWGSAIDDFHNFELGALDDDSISYTIGAGDQNEIQSMVSAKALLILTSGGEWVVSTNSDQDPISPSNVRIRRNSNFGSAPIAGLVVDNATLFVQRGARKVREYSYDFGQDNFQGVDLTLLSEHVTAGSLTQLAYQRNRDSILWAVTGAGELIGMTYERTEKVVGWHRHDTAGLFESVATIYGSGDEDEVWVAVLRTINGSPARSIERLATGQWLAAETGDLDALVFADCAKTITLTPATATVTSLSHLEGKVVNLWVDGAAHPDRTVASGAITLEAAATTVTVGLPFTSQVQTMPFDHAAQDGTTQARLKRANRARVRLRNTAVAQLSVTPASPTEAIDTKRLDIDVLDASPAGITGDVVALVPPGHLRQSTLTVTAVGAAPLHLLAVFPELQTTER